MKPKITNAVFLLFALSSIISCKKDDVLESVTVIKANGDITTRLNEFRHLLGDQLNNAPGVVGGRREVNWDGVAEALLDKPLSPDFFNTVGEGIPASRQRGLVYSSAADNFQVSNNGFKNTNPVASGSFEPFSGKQIFANLNSNFWHIGFRVAGQSIPASVKGFGIVFLDVDQPNSTFLEFFNGARSIGKFFAPVHDDVTNVSFLGVYFHNEIITQIKVGHNGRLLDGTADISNGGPDDLVAFDDFLYDEPAKQ